MSDYSFYSLGTGEFSGIVFSGREGEQDAHCPPGFGAIGGRFSAKTHRFNLETLMVEAQPASGPPDTDPVEASTVPGERATLVSKLQRVAAALERGTDRLLREAVLSAPSHPAYARMAAIEAAVAPIRAAITAAMAASTKEELDAIKAGLT